MNGANSGDMIETVKAIARNASTDYPVLAFYATIGDDICSQDKSLDRVKDLISVLCLKISFS